MSRQHTRYKEALKITYFSEYKCNTHHLIGDKIIFLIYISLIIPNLTYFSCFFSGSYVFFFFFFWIASFWPLPYLFWKLRDFWVSPWTNPCHSLLILGQSHLFILFPKHPSHLFPLLRPLCLCPGSAPRVSDDRSLSSWLGSPPPTSALSNPFSTPQTEGTFRSINLNVTPLLHTLSWLLVAFDVDVRTP